MYITMITPECAPVAKAGGLGDVVQGLSRELAMRGNSVDIILPKYDCMRYDRIWDMSKSYTDLWVPYYHEWIHCDVHFGFVDGLNCYFIEPHSHHRFFERGLMYGAPDDVARFGFFSRAALEFMIKSGKRPDIIHCHDWQTGLVPVLLYEIYQSQGMERSRVCYTLHNLGHQGITGPQVLEQCGLDRTRLATADKLADPRHNNAINLMKGGIVYANFVTTVSPRYADEIRYTEQGQGLQGVLQRYSDKLGGVLNGIDYSVWNPEIDPHLPAHYSPHHLENKRKCKTALRQRLLLRDELKPMVAVVSRLDRQKGVHLIVHALEYALRHGCQFTLLGMASEEAINRQFWGLKHYHNDNPDCHLEIGYDEELAHLMYAGADIIVIPSLYEPCGLTQLIALKYGTVPVVRATGGLADTVFDANHAERPYEERNGYVFHDYTETGLESALSRAIGLWRQYPEYFRQLRQHGMCQDYSWNHPGQHYLNIYDYIQAKS